MSTSIRWLIASVLLLTCAIFVVFHHSSDVPLATPSPGVPVAQRAAPTVARVLKIVPDALNFGEIPVGERKTLQIEVQNPGTKPVLIYRMLFTCSCLSGTAERLTIAPGESAYLPVTFEGQPGKRTISTQASMITDEPGACRYDVPVLGQVLQEFLAEPDVLNFGRLSIEESRATQFALKRSDGKAFSIQAIKSTRGDITFSWTPSTPGKENAYAVVATFKPSRAGTLSETASLFTDRNTEGVPLLTLGAEVEGNISPVPSVVTSSWGGDKTLPSFEVALRSKTGKAIKVREVKEGGQRPVKFSQEAKSPAETILKISFEEGTPPGRPIGEFLIMVEGEAQPIHLPYRIELPRPASRGNP